MKKKVGPVSGCGLLAHTGFLELRIMIWQLGAVIYINQLLIKMKIKRS